MNKNTTFSAGQKVLCIDDVFPPEALELGGEFPQAGHIYTITSMKSAPHGITGEMGFGLQFAELPEARIRFNAHRFVSVEAAARQSVTLFPWECLMPDPEPEWSLQSIKARFPIEKWGPWGSALTDFESERFQNACYSQDNVTAVILVVEKDRSTEPAGLTVCARFPALCQGARNELELFDVGSFGAEPYLGALQALTSSGREILFFDPDFSDHHDHLKLGGHYLTELGGLVSVIEPMAKSIEISSGPVLELERERLMREEADFDPAQLTSASLSMEEFRSLTSKDAAFWYEFVTKVENLQEVSFEGRRGWNFEGTVENGLPVGHEPLRLGLVVMEHIAKDYRPQEGDLVGGIVFLQGLLKQEVSAGGTAWADQPSAEDAMRANVGAMMDAYRQHAAPPPHLRMAAQVLAMAGWEVTLPEPSGGVDEPPWLQVERGERRLTVALSVNGQSAPDGDALLVVTCRRMGEGHELQIDNFDEVEESLGLITSRLWVKHEIVPVAMDGSDC